MRDQDLQEATLALARLMKEEKDFYINNIHARRPKNEQEEKWLNKQISEFEILKSKTRLLENILAANPNFFNIIEPWVISIEGNDSVSKETMEEYIESADVEELIDRTSCLASSIKYFIRSAGYFIADMGSGVTGWDIGIRCSEKEAKKLCNSIHSRYTKALELGLITVSKRFCGNKLPGLYNYEDAERIIGLHEKGDTIDML